MIRKGTLVLKDRKKENIKLADRKGQRPAFPFDRKKGSLNTLLKRVRRKNVFEATKKVRDKNSELAQIWDEDLCE